MKLCDHHACGVNCSHACTSFVCTIFQEQTPGVGVLRGDAGHMLFHSNVYAVADKYDIPGLGNLSRVNFEHTCDRFWNAPEFAEAAEHAYSTTPNMDDKLRKVFRDTIFKHRKISSNQLSLLS
jgi:hypothetical protein